MIDIMDGFIEPVIFVILFVVFVLVVGRVIEKYERPDVPELFKRKDDK